MNKPTCYAFCYGTNYHLMTFSNHHNRLTQIGPHNEPTRTSNHCSLTKEPNIFEYLYI